MINVTLLLSNTSVFKDFSIHKEKLEFRDRLEWKVGLTVETKPHF